MPKLLPQTELTSLQAQIKSEYNIAWKHMDPKRKEWEVRLQLYNNQRRDKDAVGDTTLFTIFQTLLASLYIDKLSSNFSGRKEGDDDVAENLTSMATFDYTEMEKDQIDYDWIWDTAFFGRGLLSLQEYERDPDNGIYLPIPEVIDPMTFLRDPFAASVNGNKRGKGAALYMGRPILMTGQEIEEHPCRIENFNMSELKFGDGIQNLLRDAVEARDLAQGRQNQKLYDQKDLGVNSQYEITEWYTHIKAEGKVKKCKVWLANERSKIIAYKILENRFDEKGNPVDYEEDSKEEKEKKYEAKERGQEYTEPVTKWQIIDRPLYPTSHDWDGTSVPDLTEDKQRARATAQNLGLNAMKADLYPMYAYDSNKITNRKDLKFNFNKFIPVDARGERIDSAIAPIIKSRPNMQLLDFIYNSIDASAQKATATPELQQGAVSEEQRTLGEINLIASKVDTRYSLAAKVFGWSEKRFWMQWYHMYKDNFMSDIDEKVLRLEGAFGAKWRPLRRKDIITSTDPDIKIESEVLSRAKQLEERQSMTSYLSLALQEPTSNRRYGLKKLARIYGMEHDEVERLFPPTIEERIAEKENESLSKNKPVAVKLEDDHNVHLEIHKSAGDTKESFAHITTHEEALSIKKVLPGLFPEDIPVEQFQPPAGEGGQQLPIPNQAPQSQQRPIAQSQASGTPQPQVAPR